MSFKKHLFLKCASYQLCIIKKMKEIESDIVTHDRKIDILNISVDIVIHRGWAVHKWVNLGTIIEVYILVRYVIDNTWV